MAAGLTRNLAAAHDAFAKGNTDQLKLSHSSPAALAIPGPCIPEPAHKSKMIQSHMNKYGKGFIFGGTYSLVLLSIFISIVRSAHLSHTVYVGFGAVCVLSCGCFIAVSDYLNSQSDRELIQWERKRESWEYDNFLEGEQREMIELLVGKRVKHDDAQLIIGCLSKYKDPFVDFMMTEELGLLAPLWTPLQHSAAVFVSFLLGGFLVLTPAVYNLWRFGNPQSPLGYDVYWESVTLAAASIFPLGCLRSYFMEGNKWWRPGVTELANLVAACTLAYILGGYVRQYLP